MFKRISTGKIELNQNLHAKRLTRFVDGEIEKIVVTFGTDCDITSNLVILTSDGETMLNISGDKSGIYYPANLDVMSQKMVGIKSVSDLSTPVREKYTCFGNMPILFVGSNAETDFIENIDIIIKGDIRNDLEPKVSDSLARIFSGALELVSKDPIYGENKQNMAKRDRNKDDAPVTTDTPGTFNPRFSSRRRRRKDLIGKAILKIRDDIIKESGGKLNIKKQRLEDKIPEFSDFIDRSFFSTAFKGISVKQSELIEKYILRSIVKGISYDNVIKYLERKGVDNAGTLLRTEKQAISNKIREFAFLNTDPDQEEKYDWIGPADKRRTDICKNITERTKDGVTIDKLKEIINEEVDAAKSRGELPGDFESRDWTPHFSCRHTFTRHFD